MTRSRREQLCERLVASFLAVIIFSSLIVGFLGAVPAVLAAKEAPELMDQGKYALSASSSEDILSMNLDEDVTIREDGRADIALVMDVPDSALADAYRKSLGVGSEVPQGQEMPIPENVLLGNNADIDGQTINAVIPVKAGFCESIEQQQRSSIGLITHTSASSAIPRNDENGCTVSMTATGLLAMSSALQSDGNYKCEVLVRPPSPTAIAGSVFSSVEMVQMMLESVPGEQTYEFVWNTRIFLPEGATLLNAQEIAETKWTIALGGGTYIVASVTIQGTSIVLAEKTVVSENPILASPRYLYDAFSHYKAFSIQYQLPRQVSPSLEEYYLELALGEGSGDTWSYTWTITWSDTESVSFAYGPLNAELSASASLSLTGYVGWDFDIFQGLTSFESWMSLGASIQMNFEATASASYSKEWEYQFFDWATTYTFMVGVVPVWADLHISATGVLSVNAYGQISLTASATASATFTAGVRWTSTQGWSGIFDVASSAEHTGPTLDAEAGVCVRPSLRFRIAFLFYGVAGPFVEFEPYALATITCTYPPPHGEWSITANFQITAGATFAGWLKDLLGLDDYSVLLYNAQLMVWSGSWGSSTITISETLSPTDSPPEGSVLVYGLATFNDGSPVSYADVKITVAGSSWTTTTDGTGAYSRFISAPSSVGTHSVQASITTGLLSATNSKTLVVSSGSPSGSRYTLYRTTTCKDVQSSDPYDPIEETAVFRRTDTKAVVWLHFTDIYEYGRFPLIGIRWDFYDPSGSLYYTGYATISDPGEGLYWLWFKAWGYIWISGYQAADMEGRWHCKVYVDEGSGYQFKVLEEFVIGYENTDRTTAKDVQTYDPYEPITRTDAFLNTDPKAWGWIRLDKVAESLEIKWEWYDPSQNKYGEFFWTTENPSDYHEWYKAWCWIAISGQPPQSKLGLWQVKAFIKDVYGSWDLEYSQYFTITDNTPPGAPGTPSDDGDYSTTGTATWNWVAAQEDGIVARYQIQIGTAPGGNNVFDGYVTSLSKAIEDLPSGMTYYARVRAMNGVGQWGPWSGNSNGITVDRSPVTILVEGPSETISYDDVTFSWKGTDDVTPTASLVYSFCLIGKDATWSSWQSTTSTQYSDLPDGNYAFRVKAKDLHGSEDPTPANTSFTVVATCFSVSSSSYAFTFTQPSTGSTSQTCTISVTSISGWEGTVYLSGSWKGSPPNDVSVDFEPVSVFVPGAGSGASTATIEVGAGVYVGEYTLQVTATWESISHPIDIAIAVDPSPPSTEVWPRPNPPPTFNFVVPTNYFEGCSRGYGPEGSGGQGFWIVGEEVARSSLSDISSRVNYVNPFSDRWMIIVIWNQNGDHHQAALFAPAGTPNGYDSGFIGEDGVTLKKMEIQASEIWWGYPTELSAVASSSQITLSWTSNTNGGESGFWIERKTGSDGGWTEIGNVGTGVTTYDDQSLDFGNYYYRVRAFSGVHNAYTEFSNEASATVGSDAFLAVRGAHDEIYYRIYDFGSSSWEDWRVIPYGATCDSPAAAVCCGKLFLVVRGMDGQSLWFGWIDLSDYSFSGWILLDGATPSAPTLVSYDSKLALVVRGFTNIIYYRSYDCVSETWTEWIGVSDGATCDSPAAAVLGTNLHLVVRGFSATDVSGNNTLWHGTVNLADDSFSGWDALDGWAPSAPRIAASETLDKLYLVVRGGDDRIWINSWNGAAWDAWTALPSGATYNSPAAVVIDEELHIVVRCTTGMALWYYHINLLTNDHSDWARIEGWSPSAPMLTR